MNPREYYKKLSGSVKEADLRLVAEIMSEYVGEDNRITNTEIRLYSGIKDERKVRIILKRLLREYGLPVCGISGKAGYWLAGSFEETLSTRKDYRSRARENNDNADAFQYCHFPPEESAKNIEPILQPLLFGEPEVRGYRNPLEG